MPGPDTERETRGGGRMLAVLFWTGVALAPLAALLLLVANSGLLLRCAAVAAIGCVVLIGVSIALRGDPDSVRAELEGTVLDEVDALREDVRQDITTAARATHRAFGEKFQALSRTVDELRADIEAGRAGAGVPAGRGAARHPEPARTGSDDGQRGGYERGRSNGYDPAGYDEVRQEQPRSDRPRQDQAQPDRYGRVAATVYGAAAPQHPAEQQPEPAPWGGGQEQRGEPAVPRQRAGGRVRHTETVQVTTRETVVDDDAGRGYGAYGRHGAAATGRGYGGPTNGYGTPGGGVYGGAQDAGYGPATANGYVPTSGGGPTTGGGGHGATNGRGVDETDGVGWAAAAPPTAAPHASPRGHRAAEPGAPSWGDRRDAGPPPPAPTGWGPAEQPGSWSGQNGASRGEPRQQVQAGERWAAARADERGSEMRMAERRAAMRADATGAELRVENRWASVRREEPQEPAAGGYGGGPAEQPRAGRRRRDDDTNPGPGPAGAAAAQPVQPAADGWGDDWMSALRDGPTAPELSARSDAPAWSDYEASGYEASDYEASDYEASDYEAQGGGRRRRDESETPGPSRDEMPHAGAGYQYSQERWR